MRRQHTGIVTLGWLTVIGAEAPDVITAAAGAGFSSVSIRITGRKLGEAYTPIVGNPAMIRELRQRLEDGGLRLSNTSTYHLYPDVTLAHLLPVIEATAELGADTMVVTSMDADEARFTDLAAHYAAAAAQAGLRLALEFVPYSQARTIGVGDRIVRNSGAKNFGLLVDSLHLDRSGGTPADIATVDPQRIFFAQICDAKQERPALADLPYEARNGRLYPGDGALPMDAFLDALPEDVELECEMPRVDLAALSPLEQASRAGDALRAFLATRSHQNA